VVEVLRWVNPPRPGSSSNWLQEHGWSSGEEEEANIVSIVYDIQVAEY
jgi:hypothetical protein